MKNYKYKVYLDCESTGLKGKLNLIQYSINQDERIYIFRPFLQEDHAQLLLNILNCEEALIIGYNVGFDLFKLYQHYGQEFPFKCDCLDLYLHTLRGKPLNKYPVKGKNIIKISKVPEIVSDELEELVMKKLQEILPNFFDIKCSHHLQDKERKDLITLSFKISFSLSSAVNLAILSASAFSFSSLSENFFCSLSSRTEIILSISSCVNVLTDCSVLLPSFVISSALISEFVCFMSFVSSITFFSLPSAGMIYNSNILILIQY
jgi:hypothetical protein